MAVSGPKKITVVSRLYAPEVGAAAFRLRALVDQLVEKGADVTVVTTKTPPGTPLFTPNYRVSRWPVLRDSGGNVRGYIQYLSFDIPMCFRILFGRKPDVYVVEPPPTSGFVVKIVAALRRVPFVYFSADVSSSAARGIGVSAPIVAALTAVEKSILKSAGAVLAVSDGVRLEVDALTDGRANIVTVGTGVDTDAFSVDGPAMDPGYEYFIYAGTMSEIQGASVFVDAFLTLAADYPTVRLAMFGQGVELARLKETVAQARGNVDFHSPAAGTEIAHWQRGCVANLASVRPERGYDFAFATKALAGLAAGAPTIYAGVGPVGRLIDENALGIACEWDVAQVAAAMRQLLENPVPSQRRYELSEWVQKNYSLRVVGESGAAAVLRIAAGAHDKA